MLHVKRGRSVRECSETTLCSVIIIALRTVNRNSLILFHFFQILTANVCNFIVRHV